MLTEQMNEAKVFGSWAFSSILDALFLVFWVILQWGVQNIVAPFPLKGLDQYVLIIFRFIFAFATLIPVLLWIIVDSIKMYYQARTKIGAEKRMFDSVQS